MCPKDADGMANSVDPDQTTWSSLIWVYTVCLDLPVQKLRIIFYGLCRVKEKLLEMLNEDHEFTEADKEKVNYNSTYHAFNIRFIHDCKFPNPVY